MNSDKNVIFLHGFASSAGSRKATYLREKFEKQAGADFHAIDFNPTPRDFEFTTVTGQIDRLRQFTIDRNLNNMILIGSSFGAMVGLHYARRYAGVEYMLLLAPALIYMAGMSDEELQNWRRIAPPSTYHFAFKRELPLSLDVHEDGMRYRQTVPPAATITIIHGRRDGVVPIEGSREYATKYPDRVQLVEVDSDHLLHDQLDTVWQCLMQHL
jgi:pimeloyl-ACP methyl ester carboxylesterase